MPEHRLNAEFKHFMDKHDQVMTQNLAESFVDHRGIGFAAERVAKLSLQHAERGFYVRTLVVVLQKLFLAKVEVVCSPAPRNRLFAAPLL